MNTIVKFALIMFVTMHVACNSGSPATGKENKADTTSAVVVGKPVEKSFANIQFASKYDTTCGMPLSAGVEDTLHVNDKIYGFCSKECKDEFINKLKTQKK